MHKKIICQECLSDNIEINSEFVYYCLDCGTYNAFEEAYDDDDEIDSKHKKLRDREGWD